MDEHDELTDDIDEATYRERAAAKLDQIAQKVKQALANADAGIAFDIFFTVPSSGHSILTFGTIADPDDETWKTVGEIVSAVVRRAIGLDRSGITRCDCMRSPTRPATIC